MRNKNYKIIFIFNMEYKERLEKVKEKLYKEDLKIKTLLYAYKKHIKKLYNIIFVSINLNIFFIFCYIHQK